MHKYLLALLLAVLVSFLVIPSVSYAEDGKVLDTVVSKYNTAAKEWEPVLKQAAKRLFLILCVTSLVFTAGFGFLRGGMGFGDFFTEFLRFGISMGFFYWLLENGPVIAKAIIDSMTMLGQTASSNYIIKLTPSDICTQGFGLIYDAVAEFGKSSYATGVLVIVIALIIALVYAVIAAQMIVLLCSSWILIYGGVFYLGFGGGHWTSEIAKNYFKTILAQAMQVFSFCLILGIGQTEILSLTSSIRTTKTVTVPNYWWLFEIGGQPTKQIQTDTLTLTGMCVALVFAVILAILVNRVPGLIAGVINGSSISSMAFGGVGGAVGTARGVMGATTGAIMGAGLMAGQAAGAKMALSSAYSAMQDHKANGEGSFANGGATGGLRGAWHSATDMASNLSTGAGGVLQRTTTGGMMSSHIDGKVQEQKAEREKEKAEQAIESLSAGDVGGDGAMNNAPLSEHSGTSSVGESVGVTGTSGDGMSAMISPTEGSGYEAGGDDSFDNGGTVRGAAQDGGLADDSSPTPPASLPGMSADVGTKNTGSNPAARIASQKTATIGKSAFSDITAFGAEYSDMNDEADEWDAAIANYDPKKVGIPDG